MEEKNKKSKKKIIIGVCVVLGLLLFLFLGNGNKKEVKKSGGVSGGSGSSEEFIPTADELADYYEFSQMNSKKDPTPGVRRLAFEHSKLVGDDWQKFLDKARDAYNVRKAGKDSQEAERLKAEAERKKAEAEAKRREEEEREKQRQELERQRREEEERRKQMNPELNPDVLREKLNELDAVRLELASGYHLKLELHKSFNGTFKPDFEPKYIKVPDVASKYNAVSLYERNQRQGAFMLHHADFFGNGLKALSVRLNSYRGGLLGGYDTKEYTLEEGQSRGFFSGQSSMEMITLLNGTSSGVELLHIADFFGVFQPQFIGASVYRDNITLDLLEDGRVRVGSIQDYYMTHLEDGVYKGMTDLELYGIFDFGTPEKNKYFYYVLYLALHYLKTYE